MGIELVETDVLVIGAGISGITAAIKAHDAGSSVLLLTKGPFGRDCAATWMAGTGFQSVHYPPDGIEAHVDPEGRRAR